MYFHTPIRDQKSHTVLRVRVLIGHTVSRDHLCEKGSGKAICATARKLLTIIFVMLKKELDYWYLEDRLYNRKLRQLNAVA